MDNSKLLTSAKFFERLDSFLETKHITLYQLCSDVDISPDTFYKARNRKALPNLQSICILCDALDITLAEFFSPTILSADCKAILDSLDILSEQSLSVLATLVKCLR